MATQSVSASVSPPPRPASSQRSGREDEGGYVLAMTALLLIPLMIFAALAVDVGSWYVKASDTQRAADAAALAAVVWMPDTTRAQAAAEDVARRNGFDPADPDVTITMVPVNSQSVRVEISDKGDMYFGSVVQQTPVTITRFATAEFILPVPMGNPASALGTGNLGLFGQNENMWLAVSGYCSGRQQGDHISARYQGVAYACPGAGNLQLRINGGNYTVGRPSDGIINPQYDPNGYYLIVDMPPASAGTSFDVQFYDPGYCDPRAEGVYTVGGVPMSAADFSHSYTTANPALLVTQMYAADDTQITDEDNLVASNRWPAYGTGELEKTWPVTQCGWSTAYRIDGAAKRGRWILNYRTPVDTNSLGMNVFGIRVVPSGTGTVCKNLGPGSACPRVFAKDWMGIYVPNVDKAGNPMVAPGQPASFYLAEIGEEHRGKTLELTLFDPGEGMANLQIVTPQLRRLPFSFETIDNQLGDGSIVSFWNTGGAMVPMTDIANTASSAIADCFISGTVAAGDPVTPTGGNYDCLRVDGNLFQNRTVRIKVPLPNDYTCDPDCWFRIRYEPEAGGSVTDRTTWSIRVIGDPVRLSE